MKNIQYYIQFQPIFNIIFNIIFNFSLFSGEIQNYIQFSYQKIT